MKQKIKKYLLYIWNKSIDILLYLKDYLYMFCDRIYSACTPAPKVLSIEESIDIVLRKKLSISRYGDGEIKLIAGHNLPFQQFNCEIQKRLIEVLSSNVANHLVCLSDVFEYKILSKYTNASQKHWKKHLSRYRKHWYSYLVKNKTYGNTFMTRCYIILKDKSTSFQYFKYIKKIWDGKDILLIEGEKSRLGVGNDLFENANSIKRILAPNMEAWDYYKEILKEIEKYNPKEHLILLALGPTATIMAYDLAIKGYRAIDIGHIDIEYEWYKRGAEKKMPIPNKFVNEAGAGIGVGDIIDNKYKTEIVCQF